MNPSTIASSMTHWLEPWQIEAAMRMLVTIALTGAIGLERELHGREAGFRTHLLVGLGCCLIMLVSLHFERVFAAADASQSVLRIDPARLAAGTVAGIGFLGAGVIVKTGVTVRGLTTAASLWCVAALGLALGIGMYAVTLFAAALMFVALTVLHWVGASLPKQSYHRVHLGCGLDQDLTELADRIRAVGATIQSTRVNRNNQAATLEVTYRLRFTGWVDPAKLLRAVTEIPQLRFIEIA